MTLRDQIDVIGKKAYISIGGLTLTVTVEDYKKSYGKDRWLVRPLDPIPGQPVNAIWVENIEIAE